MPYYNQLYKSELLEFNPFYDVDLTRNREGSGTSNKSSNNTETNSGTSKNVSSGSGTSNTDTLNRFSDTPQNSMDTQGIADSAPLTTVTKVNEDNTTTNNNTDTITRNDNRTGNSTENINNTDKYIEKIKGKQGTKKFRETFLNIDMMIIEDCNDCFFTLW